MMGFVLIGAAAAFRAAVVLAELAERATEALAAARARRLWRGADGGLRDA